MTIYAWIGEDELGSGRVGIKQGVVPAGYIPLAAMDFDAHKLKRLAGQMNEQARQYGKRIYLARFTFDTVEMRTEQGAPAQELEL